MELATYFSQHVLFHHTQTLHFTAKYRLNSVACPCLTTMSKSKSKSKSKLCYDRQSAGQSVFEQSTHLGLTTRSWLLSDSCGFVDLGRPLWWKDGSAVCNCYWPSPAQSSSGSSPVGFVAIFYCLRFKTSLFVASYDSRGHGGGIRPHLLTGLTTMVYARYIYSLVQGSSQIVPENVCTLY
jgi:hypothetical protein